MDQDKRKLAAQAALLKKYRKKKRLTQSQVAIETQLKRSAIAMLESGKRGKKSDTLITLLKFYGVSIKSFDKRVYEWMNEEDATPYEFAYEMIDHEWFKLEQHEEEQKKDTINDFAIRQHVAKNYGTEALGELNKLVSVYYEIHGKNRRLNNARRSKDIKVFRPRNSLFLGKLTVQDLKKQKKKNYATIDSTDRYFKRLAKLFFYFIHKTLSDFSNSENRDYTKDSINIVRSLVAQNSKVFGPQLLLSNEMAAMKGKEKEDLEVALLEYIKESIAEMKRYVSKYPKSYRDNFKKILEADRKE